MISIDKTSAALPGYPEELNEASLFLDQAIGFIDLIYTLEVNGHIDGLCSESLGSSLAGLMDLVSRAKKKVDSAHFRLPS